MKILIVALALISSVCYAGPKINKVVPMSAKSDLKEIEQYIKYCKQMQGDLEEACLQLRVYNTIICGREVECDLALPKACKYKESKK